MLLKRVLPSLIFFVSNCISAPGVIKLEESKVTTNALSLVLDHYYLHGLSFQQDAVVSHNGWQYVAFYNSVRRVTIARRQLPAENWQVMSLTNYRQRTNDAHNIISIGIAPNDGTIHLAFDHHINNLHYCKSIPDLASNPEAYCWSDSLFGPVIYQLIPGSSVTRVTYPRFVSTPEGDLQFVARIGTSGDGESYLWEYNGSTSEWTALGKFVDNPNGGNAYLNGFHYDKTGRLHTSWVKRETPDPSTNHDLYYIYSDDNGRTWQNNSGDVIGTSGSDPVIIEEPKVWTIPTNNGLINQEAQTIDNQGRFHVFLRRDVERRNYQFHYWRDTDGTWHETNTGIRTKNWYQRSKIAADMNDNVYAIMPRLVIASASASTNWSDWIVVNKEDENRFHSEPLYDWYRLYNGDGILSVVYQERNSGNLMVLSYQLNAQTTIESNRNQTLSNHFSLKQNYPNPFNPETQINYTISQKGKVTLKVYDVMGKEVTVLRDMVQAAGLYHVSFDRGQLDSGVYFYQLRFDDQVMTKKMLLVK